MISLKKKLLMAIVLIILGMLFLVACGKKEEDYRQIQVYKIDGTATVARQGSNMDAYENMQLQSGDIIETIKDSYLQLKLDEDKYILVEPESKISLQATGNSIDSKTSIYLEKGAIVNQLDNPLSEDSSYEVTTPNSTMAVRGTTFRVEITIDEKGESHAKVAVYGGKVECNLVFPDGTIAEPVMVEKGTEVLIWGDDVETEYVGTGNITYEEMKTVVLDFLDEIIDRGEELSISKEEIVEIKKAIESLEKEIEEEKTLENELTEEESAGNTLEDETLAKEESAKEEIIEQSKEASEQSTTQITESTQTPEPTQPVPPTNESDDDSSEDNEDTGDSTDEEDDDTSSDGDNNTGTSSNNKNVTIYFMNGDQEFAYITVQVANTANTISTTKDIPRQPTLQPSESGSWSYGDIKDIFAKEATIDIPSGGRIEIVWSN